PSNSEKICEGVLAGWHRPSLGPTPTPLDHPRKHASTPTQTSTQPAINHVRPCSDRRSIGVGMTVRKMPAASEMCCLWAFLRHLRLALTYRFADSCRHQGVSSAGSGASTISRL